MSESRRILDVRIDLIPAGEIIEKIKISVAGHGGGQLITTNPEMILAACSDRELKETINQSWLSVPDGVGVLWALKKTGINFPDRITGIDLAEKLFALGAAAGWTFYFLGAPERVAAAAAASLQNKFPGLKISGTQHGYFLPEQTAELVSRISAVRPDILLVGLGVPRQEKFIAQNLSRLNCGVAIGIGGSFDVWSGRLRRAPAIFNKLKIEWLFRLFQEPRRFRRIISLVKFVWVNRLNLTD